MKYPQFLKENATIGLLATSCGSNVNPYRLKTQQGIKYFLSKNYTIKRGRRVFANKDAVSAPHDIRANDFNKMYKNKKIDFLWSTGGGEIMVGMLPYVDFEKIKKLPPKFFMGFSDNTNLTFTLTTICDVATIYGTSIGAFAYNELTCDTIDNYKLMKKEKLSFSSYPFYAGELSYNPDRKILDTPVYNEEVKYESIDNKNHEFNGRIIGGCLDVLVTLCGTKFDNVKNFVEKYKDDGIIWYFDICDLSSVSTYRALFQLHQAGWFKYAKGFIIGRPLCKDTPLGYSFNKAIIDGLSFLNVPIILNVDISHVKPSFPVLNGSIATFMYKDNKATITYELK